MDRRVAYLFAHVPRTGGSTFRSVLVGCFDRRYHPDYDLLDKPYTSAQVRKMLARAPHYNAHSAHKLTLDLPFDDEAVEIRVMTLVRDPVARFVSIYLFQRRHPGLPEHPARRLSFEAWVRLHEEKVEEILAGRADPSLDRTWGGQLNHLVRDREPGAALARVRELSEQGRLLLIPLDRFDEGLVLLERLYPDDFKAPGYPQRFNLSKPEEVLTPELKDRVARLPNMAEDRELHAFALQAFDERARRLFPSPRDLDQAVAELRARCETSGRRFAREERRRRRKGEPGWERRG